MTATQPVPRLHGVTRLTHLGVIRATGADAAAFLQGQLTQDVAQLDLAHAKLAAFCNPKGRMQASFLVFKRAPDDILLVCSQDLLATTLKRLSMFVMRAKAKLSDASADFALFGMAGNAIELIATKPYGTCGKTDFGEVHMVFLPPGAGNDRALWCAPVNTPSPAGDALELNAWHWLEVQSGIAPVTAAIFEAFVPQMLNYESVGGVSFKKGCYPGQEIVARSQFRGSLKRRAYLVHADVELTVAQEVFSATDPDQPCGLIAAGAPHPTGGFDAIVSMQTAAAVDALAHSHVARLTLGSASGAALQLLALPYPLLEDI